MNLAQAVGYQPPWLREPRLFGRPRTVLCQGRCCPARTAPVFVALGVKGVLLLCGECRAYQSRVARALLPSLIRGGDR